ncbi:hypothetical protein KAI87_16375, partial [Myxococcota bacterium]|nr:hypothetical protein [Myxococcota bacterium]
MKRKMWIGEAALALVVAVFVWFTMSKSDAPVDIEAAIEKSVADDSAPEAPVRAAADTQENKLAKKESQA